MLGTAAPDYLFDLRLGGADLAIMTARQKKRLEAEELSEEQQTEFKSQVASWEEKTQQYLEILSS